MFQRMLSAAMLNPSVYEDVEHDRGATIQALIVVILVSIAGGVGGLLSGDVDIVRGLIFGVIRGVLSWVLWALAALLIGTTLLKTPQTEADWGQVARGTGFAQTPGLLNVLVFIPILGGIVGFVVFIWQLAGMLFAIRESLDYNSLWRAFFVVVIALIPVLIVNAIIFALLGIGEPSTTEAPSALTHFVSTLLPG